MINFKSVKFGNYNRKSNIENGKFMTPSIKVDLSIIDNADMSDSLYKYTVPDWQEMRIDLVISSIYGNSQNAMEAIDVILALNDIDNPLNIKAGMVIIYPYKIESIDSFRYESAGLMKEEVTNPLDKLGKANKNTRVDSNRKAYIQNGYSLPPTVNKTPINPVRIEGTDILIGGVK